MASPSSSFFPLFQGGHPGTCYFITGSSLAGPSNCVSDRHHRSLSSGCSQIYLAAIHAFLWSIPNFDMALCAGRHDGVFVESNPAHWMTLIYHFGLYSRISE